MSGNFGRTFRKIRDNKQLRWLLFFGLLFIALEIGLELQFHDFLEKPEIWNRISLFWVRLGGGIGEICILSMASGSRDILSIPAS